MTEEKLNKLQSDMSNETLVELAEKQITELARTGGKSHRMCVPPEPEDTDMLFSELVKRFSQFIKDKEDTIKKLERLRDTKDYSQDNSINSGYRAAIMDSIDIVLGASESCSICGDNNPSRNCSICRTES